MMTTPTAPSQPAEPARRLVGTLAKFPANQFGYAEARHLLWRAGFGGTPAQIQAVADMGLDKAVDFLVDFGRIGYERVEAQLFDSSIMSPPTEAERREYRRALDAGDENVVAAFRTRRQMSQRADREQIREVQKWWLTRMIETPRPLEERMTLFWHGHFATGYRKIENSYHMFLQNQFFRANAVGSFETLLRGIIRDPAMLAYLDNNRSSRRQPNENLARELMELFSLGEGAYTEQDIKEGARALTGYTFEGNAFSFNERNHDSGNKTILGRRGTLDGDGFVDAILSSRACGRFIAHKLYGYFVADTNEISARDASEQRRFIDALGADLASSGYELRPTLKRLFRSDHFYHPRFRNEQIKSPVQLVVGAIRSMHTPVRDLRVLVDALDLMGQNLFFPPSVKGWDGGRSWINTSTLFVRQNALSYLLTGKLPAGYDGGPDRARFDPQTVMTALAEADPGAERDPARVVPYLLRFALGGQTAAASNALESFVAGHGGRVTDDMITGLLLLITAMPEYQLC